MALAALVQADISGVFSRLFDIYSGEKESPYGPPSHFVRETIDNPDRPVRTDIRSYLFFNMTTSAHLVVASILLQIGSVWL